jgi:hypothetical protein
VAAAQPARARGAQLHAASQQTRLYGLGNTRRGHIPAPRA